MQNIGILLLAAGSSSRFDGVKQLATYHEQSFIRRALETALAVTNNVVVVLGAHEQPIQLEIEGLGVTAVTNTDWPEGMASSIRCGLSEFQKDTNLDAIIIMVCDQPFVDTSLLNKLVTAFNETRQPIVASEYGNTVGTPALFANVFFNALSGLTGNSGAKKIISANASLVTSVSFPSGAIDIDTQDDYHRLLST